MSGGLLLLVSGLTGGRDFRCGFQVHQGAPEDSPFLDPNSGALDASLEDPGGGDGENAPYMKPAFGQTGDDRLADPDIGGQASARVDDQSIFDHQGSVDVTLNDQGTATADVAVKPSIPSDDASGIAGPSGGGGVGRLGPRAEGRGRSRAPSKEHASDPPGDRMM